MNLLRRMRASSPYVASSDTLKPRPVSYTHLILWFAEDMNSLPRKSLGYDTPDDLFEAYLDTVYAD